MYNFNKIKFSYSVFLLSLIYAIIFLTVKLLDNYRDKKNLDDKGVAAKAIVSNIEEINCYKYPTYVLYVKYNLVDGTTVESKYREYINVSDYKIGQVLNIIYSEKKPKIFLFKNDKLIEQTFPRLVFLIILLFILLISKNRIFKQ